MAKIQKDEVMDLLDDFDKYLDDKNPPVVVAGSKILYSFVLRQTKHYEYVTQFLCWIEEEK